MHELSSRTRLDALNTMERDGVDVLVVGGGITGVGVALDAVLRGLRVGLVEGEDFASGTSQWSSKMIHGGLRYLATGDVGLVREALRERKSIQQRAAHLVRPLPMLLPVYGWKVPWQRVKIGAGLWMYDLLGAWRAGVRHDWLPLDQVLRLQPNLEPKGLVGALGYADASADDVRLVLAVARTASKHGALLANGARVDRFLTDGHRVTGASVVCAGETEPRTIDAQVVINATGVWADGLYEASGLEQTFDVLPSKGIHLTVRRDVVGVETGIAFFSQTDNSNVFIEPWQDDLAFIGTSDDPYDGDINNPAAEEEEIAKLLRVVNEFVRTPIQRSDVLTTWAGLRPLVNERKTSSGKSKDISRKHKTVETPGLVTLIGGKLTTYRAMAEEGVDVAVRQLNRSASRCTTDQVPLEGSDLVSSAATVDRLSQSIDVSRRVARHLLRRYGSSAVRIEELCKADPSLTQPLHPERPYIAAEAVFGFRYEMARSVDDILWRRTRLGIETADHGELARERVAEILAAESALGDTISSQ